MAGKCKTVTFVMLLTLADLAATTLLYMNGVNLNKFLYDINFFNIFTTLLDLWALGLLRVCVLFGAVLSVLYNTRDAVPRIKLSRSWASMLPAAVITYTVVKLLLYSEKEADILHKAWFWAQFGWSIAGCVMFYLSWTFLSKINTERQFSVNKEEGSMEETAGLIGNETNDKKEKKEMETGEGKSAVLKLLSYSKPDILYILPATAFLFGAAISDIYVPYYTGLVIDGIAIDKSQEKFTRAIVIMTLLSISSSLCAGLRGGIFVVALARLSIRLRNCLFKSVTEQEIGFFDSVKTGDITSRLTSDTTTMSDMLSLNTNVFLRSFVKGVGTLVFMFKLSWQLTIFTMVMVPIVAGVSKVYGSYMKKLSKAVQDSLAKANEVAEEAVAAMRTVRSFANESGECGRYSDKLKETYKIRIKVAFAYGGYTWTTRILDLTMVVLTLYYGGHLVITNRLTGGNLVSFILYQLELGDAIEGMGTVYTGLMQAVGASEKVFEYIDRKPEVENSGLLAPDKLEGHIEFKHVSFAYPVRKDVPVLKDVSFKVSPGEVVALVGPSGSGKSTCVNLLEHFYETMSGQVLLDGNPIMTYDHKFLHRVVALVGQEPVLFARSIKDNISYALDNCSLDEVQHVARQANAHQFITELPEGYETETGEKGMQLSGGQKQRVAIARALIRRPVVLLLDEATSALDAESEHLVQQAIQNLHGQTLIVIAHRLSTVEKADRIIVIDKGSVVEQGRHTELMQRDGLYAKLVQRQLLGMDTPGDTRDKESNSSSKEETKKLSKNFYGSMNGRKVKEKKGTADSDSDSDSDSSGSSVEVKV